MSKGHQKAPKSAAFVAHPGHELRLHGWMSRTKPLCMILTTGSRSGEDRARLNTSATIIENVGGHCSSLFGVVLDRDLYKTILEGDLLPFHHWTDRLTDLLVENRIQRLIVDGWQLYSVTHDLTHIMGRLAAERASRVLGYEIEVLQYEVVPGPLAEFTDIGQPECDVSLSDSELGAKMAAIKGYPDIELELMEIEQIEQETHAKHERFFSPPPIERLTKAPPAKPRYEAYGEARLAQGTYKNVIRWSHVEKIIRELVTVQRRI